MRFLSDYAKWVRDRIEYLPQATRNYCGDLTGLRVLNVGCGDRLADVGLVSMGVEHIIGLDVHERDWDVLEHPARQIRRTGHPAPVDYATRLTYRAYDGIHFPFPTTLSIFSFAGALRAHR